MSKYHIKWMIKGQRDTIRHDGIEADTLKEALNIITERHLFTSNFAGVKNMFMIGASKKIDGGDLVFQFSKTFYDIKNMDLKEI